METVTQSPVEQDPDLHFLTEWGVLEDRTRSRKARVFSVAAHVLLITGLMLLPKSVVPTQSAVSHLITPLIEPLTELTQKAPSHAKSTKDFHVETIPPRPRIQIPRSIASTTRPAAPPVNPARPAPPVNLPEPPKVEASREGPKIEGPPVPQAPPPPPQIQTQEKPKLALENVGAPPASGKPTGKLAPPSTSIQEAMRNVVRGGAGGGVVVGDIGIGQGGIGEGLNLPPSPGRTGSNLELLSDPMGVDFRPYLIQILAAVRRNWLAVMPESAKLGRQGRVGIQFAIARDGSVPKLVIVTQSGTDALDRAAVAGISASNPFPQLPTEFKGNQIRLQFNFVYNMAVR